MENKETKEGKTRKGCTAHLLPLRDALDILGGKWKIPILMSLTFGEKRFKELTREVGVMPKMLSKELKELELNQLITRTVIDSTPVTVIYSLSEYGHSIYPVVDALKNWGSAHRKRIKGEEPDTHEQSTSDCIEQLKHAQEHAQPAFQL